MERPSQQTLLIQDNQFERAGRMAAAADHGFEVEVLDHWAVEEIRGRCLSGHQVISIVDHRPGRWDQYGFLSQLLPSARMVIACPSLPNPVLRLRMASVGVAEWVLVDEIEDAGSWVDLVAGHRHGTAPTVTSAERSRHALGLRADPEGMIRWIRAEGIEDAFAFDRPQHQTGLSRRQILRARHELSMRGDIHLPLHRRTGGHDRREDVPHWRDIVEVVDLARGAST